MSKSCARCGLEKEVTYFPRNSRSKDGYFSYCKECQRIRNQLWRNDTGYKFTKQERAVVKSLYSVDGNLVSRYCPSCREQKSGDAFYSKVETYCKDCSRSLSRKNQYRKYGLSFEDYNELLESHNKRCAICDDTADLCVDHDHSSGNVRGILCRKCNTALGALKDSSTLCMKAAAYLISNENLFTEGTAFV